MHCDIIVIPLADGKHQAEALESMLMHCKKKKKSQRTRHTLSLAGNKYSQATNVDYHPDSIVLHNWDDKFCHMTSLTHQEFPYMKKYWYST